MVKCDIRIGILAVVLVIGASAVRAVAPEPGSYDPKTLTFYKTGAKVPNFKEEPPPVNLKLTRSTMKVIVLCQNASDQTHTFEPDEFEAMMFSDHTYPTGSMRDFYLENSYGQLTLQGNVAGWYTAAHDYNYYTQGDYGFPPTGRAPDFVREAILNADADVDFSEYDNDGDGVVEGLIVIHQGPGGEDGNVNYFWSHKGYLSPPVEVDGVTITGYDLDPERKDNGNIETIGVFAHEFGHTLGAPDLYDTAYGGGNPVGRFCIMCEGSYNGTPGGSNPAHFMSYCKALFGWLQPTEITSAQTGISLADVKMVNGPQSCYKMKISNSDTDYFLIENRWSGSPAFFDQRGTGYDSGLLLSICDERGSTSGAPWICYLRDPNPSRPDHHDGAWAAEDSQTECTPFSTVNSNGYDLPSGIFMTNVSNSGETMTFDIDLQPVFTYDHMALEALPTGSQYSLVVYVKNQAVNANAVTGTLSCNSNQVTITKNTANFGTITSQNTGNNEGDAYTFELSGSGPRGEIANFQIAFTGNGQDLSYTPVNVTIIVNPNQVLFVDDDADQKYRPDSMETYFTEALDQTGFTYDVWDNAVYKHDPEYGNLHQYQAVVWNCGKNWNKSLTDQEKVSLSAYLDNGGNLFLSAQEYLYMEYPYQGDDYIPATQAGEFPHDYLHVSQVEEDEYYYHVYGVSGSPLTNGMDCVLTDHFSADPTGSNADTGGYEWWPDNIVPDDQAETIFTAENYDYPAGMDTRYQDTTADMIPLGPAAIRYPKSGLSSQYKVVFLAFSFESMPLSDRIQFLSNSLAWFTGAHDDGIDLSLNTAVFHANDQFQLQADLYNSGSPVTVDEYVVLDVFGQAYYFWPDWTTTAQSQSATINANESIHQTILDFAWPDGAGQADGVAFWGALVNTGTVDLFGAYDHLTFGWQ